MLLPITFKKNLSDKEKRGRNALQLRDSARENAGIKKSLEEKMKSIKRIRLSLVTAFSAAAIALTAVGLNMRPVSVKAENSVVNGWNSAVARGDQTVELGIAAEDNFASFSDLQSGDVISYAGR